MYIWLTWLFCLSRDTIKRGSPTTVHSSTSSHTQHLTNFPIATLLSKHLGLFRVCSITSWFSSGDLLHNTLIHLHDQRNWLTDWLGSDDSGHWQPKVQNLKTVVFVINSFRTTKWYHFPGDTTTKYVGSAPDRTLNSLYANQLLPACHLAETHSLSRAQPLSTEHKQRTVLR